MVALLVRHPVPGRYVILRAAYHDVTMLRSCRSRPPSDRLQLPQQRGASHCFCVMEIDIRGVDEHILDAQ